MKRKPIYLLLLLLCFLTTSCSLIRSPDPQDPNPTEEPETSYTVTFVKNNGTKDIQVEVLEGKDDYKKPENPKKEGYVFDCWCVDEALTKEFDFSTDIYIDTTLYARYFVDYSYLTNKITRDTIKANVAVINSSYSGTFFPTLNSQSKGSGVIFDTKVINNHAYYFVLTNNHVIYSTSTNVEYTITDYLGRSYTATLVAKDANYDLAILRFEKTDELLEIEAEINNPSVNSDVISLGQPKGQSNAITYGTIQSYNNIQLTNAKPEETNITFQTIAHTSFIASGSSGGPLLNTDLKLIGINFAGATNKSGEFVSGHTVPIEKVREFVLTYGEAYQLTI